MNDYRPFVGRGAVNHKGVFAPDSALLAVEAGSVAIASFMGMTEHLKWKLFIPPGTRCLQVTLYVYHGEPAGKVLMRMNEPPIGGFDSVTPENAAAVDLANALASLSAGAEIPCYTPAFGGAVKLSDGRMDSPVITTTSSWLYINALQLPGQKIAQLDSRITVDKQQYLDWYASAIWDADGNPVPGVQKQVDEKWVLGRVKEVGLVEPLRKLCKATDDDALVKAAKDSGLWAALLKFTR